MQLESLGSGGAQAQDYLYADGGEAVLVDPVLERVDAYLQRIRRDELRIVAIIDTHTHADHLSGAAELSRRTSAPLMMHHQAPRACVHRRLRDGDELAVGDTVVRVMTTPGHTYDSISLVTPAGVLTGDLFGTGPDGHADETCGDVEAWEESLDKLGKLDPSLPVYGAGAATTLSHALQEAGGC